MNVVIWLQSSNIRLLFYSINVLNKLCGDVRLLGFTGAHEPPSQMKNKNYPLDFIPKNALATVDFDLLIVSGENASLVDVLKEAPSLGIDPDKIILDRTIAVPNFTLEKYQRLRHSRLSILSQNCWGGFVYHWFCLQFLSPTIDLFFPDNEFLKILRDPQTYLGKKLYFIRMNINEITKQQYPSFLLGGVEVVMLHYTDPDCVNTAKRKWDERLLRLNWDNLLVMMYFDDRRLLDEFDQLPFAKKVGIVPFETDVPSGFHINFGDTPPNDRWQICFDITNRKYWQYDLWDMLLDGKKTPLEN